MRESDTYQIMRKTDYLNECQNSSWNKLYLIVLMAITTGARKGELERLKWSDIDFGRGLGLCSSNEEW